MNTRWRMFAAITMVIVFGIAACEKDVEDGSLPEGDAERSAPRAFRVEITDGPANYARMDIEIMAVEAFSDANGWIPLTTTINSVNILSLAKGAKATIAQEDAAPVGHYSLVRVWFGDNNEVTVHTDVDVAGQHVKAGGTIPLKWKSDVHYVDVKISKTISDARGASVLLDFDAENSVLETRDAFWFTPTLRAMTNRLTGITGVINGGDAAGFVKLYNANYNYSAYSTPEGGFIVRGVTPGEYKLMIRVMKRNDAGELVEKTWTRDGIRVEQGRLTLVEGIDF